MDVGLKGILPINGAKRFFRSQGGHIIGPFAILTILTMSTLNYTGVVTRMNWVQALLWVVALVGLAYSMHGKPRK
jgi:hypothetical protein